MIGSAEPRVGGERLASGAGRFVADVRVPGMLEAAVLRSRHAHARIGRIDARRALALPGVRAVLTAADVPDKAVIPHRVAAPDGTARYLQPAIARGVVRYAGEPIALVIAEDRYVAVDALALIDVAYEPLPVCATVEAALAPGAPRLFANTDSNNVAVIRMRVGDADAAIGEAPLVIRERFTYPRQTACALETRGLVAVPPAVTGGELHLLGSTKCIHNLRAAGGGAPPDGSRCRRRIRCARRALSRGHPDSAGGPPARPARALHRGPERELAGDEPRPRADQRRRDRLRSRRAHRGHPQHHPRRHRRLRAHGRARARGIRRRAPARAVSRPALFVRSLERRDQQDAGGHAALARPPGVQLRTRAVARRGGGPPRHRRRRDQ